jgi:hypothetical protein
MGICVLDNLASTRDVKLDCAVEMSPSICLLWAHFTVHIHDELLLATQVHAPFVDDLDPMPILRQGSHILDDNVNLMRHASDAQH